MKKKIIKSTDPEFEPFLRNMVEKEVYERLGVILSEGVRYDASTGTFSFDFERDDKTDIINLTKVGYKISAFGHCFYYAYEFSDDVNSEDRTAFIHSIKFPDGKISESDKKKFITNAVNCLDKEISLPSYDLLVYPQSISELNRDMVGYLNRIAQPSIASMEMVKTLPSKIEFDYDRFDYEVLQAKMENGRPRYTQAQKEQVLKNIESMMNSIHSLDYFSIARDVKKTKYRQFIKNYYKFKNENDKKLYESIMNSNVLIIDDIATSGTTISHLLKCLRSVNDKNNIVVFSLIGKNI